LSIVSVDGLIGWRHLALDQVGSTNVEAMVLADSGDAGQIWVTALSQQAGKARRGRQWISHPGNLYGSLLLIDPAPRDALATLPLMVSLALHKAVLQELPQIGERLKIKWPNDLLLDGKKLSGILLEAQPDRHGRSAVVIGCGVNCRHFPENPLYPATSLAHEGFEVVPMKLFRQLALAMASELRIWAQGHGFAIIRREWLDRCHGLGEAIVARYPDRELQGTFIDINTDGLLLLRDEEGYTHLVSAADIFFGDSH